MRVLMLTERYYPIWGGAENQLRQLTPHLIDLGCEVQIITRRWHAEMPKCEFIDGASVFRVGCNGKSSFKTVLFTVSLIWLMLRNAQKTDIIHSHGAVAMGVIGRMISTLRGTKNVAKIATAGRILKYKNKLTGVLLLSLFKRSDAIIGMTCEIRRELELIDIPKKAVVQIANAVDSERFHPYTETQRQTWRTDRTIPSSAPVVLFSGRLTTRKGLSVLLDAWSRVLKFYPDAQLCIVGSGYNQTNSVEADAKQKVAAESLENIFFEGATSSPEDYLGIADIFVFPSLLEGFPNALLEAMASGMAIVASDIGGVVELIENNKTGLLFPPGNVKVLADKIVCLLENPGIRYRMAAKARRHVMKNYSFEKIAKQYMETYQRISS
ncbi:glycosyltransferase family 4 protein [Desulfococcaceae bacterium HSG7]|nr:glycosyltransferase family 4 protein [Desulfococcaceae bacterium HSG7]